MSSCGGSGTRLSPAQPSRAQYTTAAVQAHWKPDAAIVNGDSLEPNAAGEAYMRLVHEEWNSGAMLTAGQDGAARTRVFLGDYRLRFLQGEQVVGERTLSVDGDTTISWP